MTTLEALSGPPLRSAVRNDNRTDAQRVTHCVIVAMTDRFLSGWGHAAGVPSYAGWACKPEHLARVEQWVRSRSDAMRVRVVGSNWRPRRPSHTHIYVVGDNHPAVGG